MLFRSWRYSSDSVRYSEGVIPSEQEILDCSAESGFNMSHHSGDGCIVATADLLYFNRDTAGKAYFYFIDNDLAGLYYKPTGYGLPCSLYVRNAYLSQEPFEAFETSKTAADYSNEYMPKFTAEGIFDTVSKDGKTYMLLNEGHKIDVCVSSADEVLSPFKVIDLSDEGLIPISASFINNTTETAVLFGFEAFSSESSVPATIPSKIVIFDSEFNITENELIAEDSDFYSTGFDNGCLMVSSGRSLNYYPMNGTSIGEKQVSYYLGHAVTGMDIADLDNDGDKEYIFTDGMDIYIYHKTISVFRCIWRTHLSIESFEKYIYTGDLNRDGIKEIYVFDTTGTTSKYNIGKNGLYTQNEDIDYGQRYHVADFDSNGKADYIIISGADINTQELRIIAD